MTLDTDTHPATAPAAVTTKRHRRHTTTFAAFGIATLLAVGAGAGAATLLDDDAPATAAHRSTTAATIASITDADTLWSYLAQLPPAERDYALVALAHDPTSALRAITAGMLAAAG
jgi:hypothetical protein